MWKNQQGLSLTEVVVAVAIIVIALTPMLGMFATSRRGVEGASNRAEAAAFARTIMDRTLAQPFDAILSTTGADATMPGYTYEVVVQTRSNGYVKDVWVTIHWQEKQDPLEVQIYSAVTRRGASSP